MPDFFKIVVACSRWQELMKVVNQVKDALPPGWREQFVEIAQHYSQKYGLEGAFERINNRTIAQIFADHELENLYEPGDRKEIASGEIDGMRYQLFDAPPPRRKDGGSTDGE
jgi:hypothetical protein